MKATRLSFVVASCLLLIGIQLTLQSAAGASAIPANGLLSKNMQSGGTGAPDDPNIEYIGRWDTSGFPFVARSYWPGAYFKVHFTGTSVAIRVQQSVTFYARVDNANDVLYTNVSGTITLAQFLPPGTHSLRVATRTESAILRFQGLVLDPGQITLPAITSPDIIEFVGDSITVGNRSSKVALTSYAWLTGESLNTEHTDIAYTGVCLVDGVPCGWTTGMSRGFFKLQTIPFDNAVDWDFDRYQARIVVIDLGTNDRAYGISNSQFQSTYITFLQNIRGKYPFAEIFVMRPFNGAKAGQCQAAVNARRSAGDFRVHYIDTTGWLTSGDFVDGLHPNDQGHVKIAQRLVPILGPYVQDPPPPTSTPIPPTNTPIPPTPIPPTSTPIPPGPTNTPVTGGSFRLQYATTGTGAITNQIRPQFRIVNQTGTSVPLSQFRIRYYFTRDTAESLILTCDYAGFGCGNIASLFVPVNPMRTNTDYYLEVGFTEGAGSIGAGSTSGAIVLRFRKSTWSNFNQSNDYSFDPSKTALTDATAVTLYRNGALIWGTEPSGMAPTFVPATNTPLPSTPAPPSPTPSATPSFKIMYRANNANPSTTTVEPYLMIVNNSGATVPLYQLRIRYWLTRDSDRTLVFNCVWAQIGCANLWGSPTYLTAPRNNANTYMEIGFGGNAGNLAPFGTSGEIQAFYRMGDWGNMIQTNDYSFDPGMTAYGDAPRITLYFNGALVWGVEP
jgi:hypothetical protein